MLIEAALKKIATLKLGDIIYYIIASKKYSIIELMLLQQY